MSIPGTLAWVATWISQLASWRSGDWNWKVSCKALVGYIATTRLHGEFGVHTQQIWRLFYLHRCHVHWSHVLIILEVIFGEIWLAGSRMFASHLPPIPGKQVGTLWSNKHQGRSQTIWRPFLNAIPVISPFWFFEFGVRRRKPNEKVHFCSSAIFQIQSHWWVPTWCKQKTARFPFVSSGVWRRPCCWIHPQPLPMQLGWRFERIMMILMMYESYP